MRIEGARQFGYPAQVADNIEFRARQICIRSDNDLGRRRIPQKYEGGSDSDEG
jgi:hypothetical protein